MSLTTDKVQTLEEVDLPFLDVTKDEYIQDPVSFIEELRGQDPRGGWIMRSLHGVELTRYEHGRQMLSDKKIINPDASHFKKLGAGGLLMEYLSEGKMNVMRGEKHLIHRRNLNGPFTAGRIAAQREMYREVSNELIDGFIADGECDLIADFTHTYPITILCRAIGIPEDDIELITSVTLQVALINSNPLEPHIPAIESALETLLAYATELIDKRGAAQGDDLIDTLIALEQEGKLTKKEIVWSLVTLMQAAHFTTRNQTALIVRSILENDLWEKVAEDPDLAPAAVNEGMRFYPIVLGVTREVAEPGVIFENVEIPVGTVLRWNPMGANRDPEFFADPYTFDLDRDTKGRVPFGFGLHKCLGHLMARSDMEVAIEQLTRRLTDVRISGPIEAVATGSIWGPAALPLKFTPRD